MSTGSNNTTNTVKTKDELRRELELKKMQWENNVAKINEEKEKKERDKKAAIEQKKREEMKKRLEESRAKSLKLLEEEQKIWAQSRSELGETMDHGDCQTEYNMLESMIGKGEEGEKGEVSEEMIKIMQQRTVPMTPLVMSQIGNETGEGDPKQRIEELLDASIRTDRTLIVDKENGKLLEESIFDHNKYDLDTLEIQQTPQVKRRGEDMHQQTPFQVSMLPTPLKLPQKLESQQPQRQSSKKEEFLMKMEIEQQMKKIKDLQKKKKEIDEQKQMKMKQEILAQVLGVGGTGGAISMQRGEAANGPKNNSLPVIQNYQQEKPSEKIKFDNQFRQVDDDGINSDSEDEQENEVTASLNDRDSSEGSESIRNQHELNILLGRTLNADPYAYPATQVQSARPESETLRYTSDNSSSQKMTFLSESSKMQQLYEEHQSKNPRDSRIQSGSSKNRQDYYEKYNMDQSVKSKDYEQLYQNTGLTQQNLDFQKSENRPMTETKRPIQQTVMHQHLFQPNVFQYQPTLDASASLVNMDRTQDKQKLSTTKFKPEDLPSDLREYEERVLKQLEEEEQQYQDDHEQVDEQLDLELEQRRQQNLYYAQSQKQMPKISSSQHPVDLLESKFNVSLAGVPPTTSKDLNIPSDLQQDQDLSDGDDQAYDPLKEYYQMMKKKLDEQQAQLQKQLDKYGVDQQDDFESKFNEEELPQDTLEDEKPKEEPQVQQDQDIDDGDQQVQDQAKQQQKQAGIVMDIPLDDDEGTLKEKKMKKLEELKRRKLEDLEKRKRDHTPTHQTSKSPGGASRSPWRGGKEQQAQIKKVNHTNARDSSEESKVPQDQPLSAHVPPHILKMQEQRRDQTPTQNVTPKMTPAQKGKVFAKNSNKKLLKNALLVCLAGETNKNEREQVLQILEETEYPHYIIMFRGNLGRSDYRALYAHDGGQQNGGLISGAVYKLHGPSNIPDVLEDRMIEKFFRYESGSKAFKELTGIKGFTLTTDAATLNKAYVQQKKAGALSNILY